MIGKRFLAAALFAATAVSPAMAQDIDTTGSPRTTLASFGIASNSAAGGTFTVGTQTQLDGFALFMGNNGVTNPTTPYLFKAYIYAWDGSKPTGPALFESSLQQFAGAPAPVEYSFATGGISLASGQKYVAFFSNAGVQANNATGTGVGTLIHIGDVYAGGETVYSNSGDVFSSLLTDAWVSFLPASYDLAYKLDFSDPASPVPEPAAWGMLIGGFGLAGGMLRTRARKPVRATA